MAPPAACAGRRSTQHQLIRPTIASSTPRNLPATPHPPAQEGRGAPDDAGPIKAKAAPASPSAEADHLNREGAIADSFHARVRGPLQLRGGRQERPDLPGRPARPGQRRTTRPTARGSSSSCRPAAGLRTVADGSCGRRSVSSYRQLRGRSSTVSAFSERQRSRNGNGGAFGGGDRFRSTDSPVFDAA
jgi:hypothetical protein